MIPPLIPELLLLKLNEIPYLNPMKNMKTIHLISIVLGILVLGYGIVMAIVNGSFQEYYRLVFLGAVLAGLGLMNSNNRRNPKF